LQAVSLRVEMSMFRITVLAVAMAMSTITATAARAHPRLEGATPAANAAVTAPAKIQLVFSETLVAQLSGLDLTMTEMPGIKMGPIKMNGVRATVGTDGKTLVATPGRPLPPGTYKVDYHVVSADTHRIQGSYTFKVR
jgi:methionine-rich copper-binding protein CopC